MKHQLPTYMRSNINTDFFLGLCVGVPVTFPQEPFYLLAFLALAVGLFRFQIDQPAHRFVFISVIAATFLALLSNVFSRLDHLIQPAVAIFTSGFYIFFLFGFCVRDTKEFLKGFTLSITLISVFTIILFFLLQPYAQGPVHYLVNSKARLWAYGIIPDWPNFMGIAMTAALIINVLYFKRPGLALIILIAVLLTTSRSAYLGLALLGLFLLIRRREHPKLSKFVMVLGLAGIVLVSNLISPSDLEVLGPRLMKTADRVYLFSDLQQHFYDAGLLGLGSIRVEYLNDAYFSFHNSYLRVGIRFGWISLLLFLIIIFPKKLFTNFSWFGSVIILYFLIVSFFQDVFSHPHLIMLYSVLLFGCWKNSGKDAGKLA